MDSSGSCALSGELRVGASPDDCGQCPMNLGLGGRGNGVVRLWLGWDLRVRSIEEPRGYSRTWRTKYKQ